MSILENIFGKRGGQSKPATTNPAVAPCETEDTGKACAGSRVTPHSVTTLADREVFVFGSNIQGLHGGGAAAYAFRHFGAVWGQGEGMQGQCYALPTMEGRESLAAAVSRFIDYAQAHPKYHFLVTRVGCGIAGYAVSEVAPLFKPCIKMENVSLPADFWKELGLKLY